MMGARASRTTRGYPRMFRSHPAMQHCCTRKSGSLLWGFDETAIVLGNDYDCPLISWYPIFNVIVILLVPVRFIFIFVYFIANDGEVHRPSVGRLVGPSVGRSVPPSVGRSVPPSVSRSVRRSVGRSVGRLIGRSVCRLIGRSVGRSVCRSVGRRRPSPEGFPCMCATTTTSATINIDSILEYFLNASETEKKIEKNQRFM